MSAQRPCNALGTPTRKVVESERIEQIVTDHVAIVAAGDGLDQDGQHPVGRQAVIFHPRAGLPLEREVADLVAQPGVVGPGRRRDGRVGEAALVGDDLLDGEQPLAVAGEFRDVVGDLVSEGERALVNQLSDRTDDRLGLREEQPERLLGGSRRRIDTRLAEGAENGEFAVPRDRELGTGVAPCGDLRLDRRVELFESVGIESQRGWLGVRQHHPRWGGETIGHARTTSPTFAGDYTATTLLLPGCLGARHRGRS